MMVKTKEETMPTLATAITEGHWELAAHVLIFAALQTLNDKGGNPVRLVGLSGRVSADLSAQGGGYGKKKRRLEIELDEKLRELTRRTAVALHSLLTGRRTPGPEYSRRCDSCSFVDLCLPKTVGKNRKVSTYLKRLTGEV